MLKHISCLFLFCCCFFAAAQSLPTLGKASEITTGKLPNGIQYYFVVNPASKGHADYALLQEGPVDVNRARSALSSLSLMGSRKPFEFLADSGVGYTDKGMISYYSDATLFSFRDVPTQVQTVADSTLLMIFDIAAMSNRPQAVIISGDINVSNIRERMNLLSMVVPTLSEEEYDNSYEWHPTDSLTVHVSSNNSDGLACINVFYSAPRLSKDALNTSQMLISRMYATELGEILESRIAEDFRIAGIPLAATKFRYLDSAQSTSDEKYTISIYISAAMLDEATEHVASILGDIDRNGVGVEEFVNTKTKILLREKRKSANRSMSNAEYISMCVSAHLYGTSLASQNSLVSFFESSAIAPEKEVELFNAVIKAVISPDANIAIRFDVPDADLDAKRMAGLFKEAWERTPVQIKPVVEPDLSLNRSKLRVKSTTPEPISGGSLWTLSNGMKVIYKKTSRNGQFNYALMLRGGFAAVPNLSEGEGAFVADMLSLSRVGGVSMRDFQAMLNTNGITMNTSVGLSDLRITGEAPKTGLELVIKALLALGYNREPDPEAFEYYKKSEALRIAMDILSPRDVNSVIDSVMRPNYFYTKKKSIENLSDDLPLRTEKYFADQFEKVGDGILVLMGDLDEAQLQKDLCRMLGDFHLQTRFSQRPRVEGGITTEDLTFTAQSSAGLIGAGEISSNFGVTAVMPFTLENYMTFKVTAEIIKKSITKVLAHNGAYAEYEERVELFPTERFSLFINCRPTLREGLPSAVSPSLPLDMLPDIRRVTSNLSSIKVESADVKQFKTDILNQTEELAMNENALIEMVLIRYSEGKDVLSGYKNAVNAVNDQKVKDMLKKLDEACGIEYVIF